MGRDGVVDAVQESFDAIQEAREGLTLICSTLSAESLSLDYSASRPPPWTQHRRESCQVAVLQMSPLIAKLGQAVINLKGLFPLLKDFESPLFYQALLEEDDEEENETESLLNDTEEKSSRCNGKQEIGESSALNAIAKRIHVTPALAVRWGMTEEAMRFVVEGKQYHRLSKLGYRPRSTPLEVLLKKVVRYESWCSLHVAIELLAIVYQPTQRELESLALTVQQLISIHSSEQQFLQRVCGGPQPSTYFDWVSVAKAIQAVEQCRSLVAKRIVSHQPPREESLGLAFSEIEFTYLNERFHALRRAIFNFSEARQASLLNATLEGSKTLELMFKVRRSFNDILSILYKRVHVASEGNDKDGNCFFRATVRAIFGTEMTSDWESRMAAHLRKRLNTSHTDNLLGAFFSNRTKSLTDLKEFIVTNDNDAQTMSQEGVWADHLQIVQASEYLETPVWIVRFDDAKLFLNDLDQLVPGEEYRIGEADHAESERILLHFIPTPGHYEFFKLAVYNGYLHPVRMVRKAFSALDKSYSSWKKTPNEETGSNMLLMPCCALFALEAAAHEVFETWKHPKRSTVSVDLRSRWSKHNCLELISLCGRLKVCTDDVYESLNLSNLQPRLRLHHDIVQVLNADKILFSLSDEESQYSVASMGSGAFSLICSRIAAAFPQISAAEHKSSSPLPSPSPLDAVSPSFPSSRVRNESNVNGESSISASLSEEASVSLKRLRVESAEEEGRVSKRLSGDDKVNPTRIISAAGIDRVLHLQQKVSYLEECLPSEEVLISKGASKDDWSRVSKGKKVLQFKAAEVSVEGLQSLLDHARDLSVTFLYFYDCELSTDICYMLKESLPPSIAQVSLFDCQVAATAILPPPMRIKLSRCRYV